jgi:hypothetical protein
MKRRLLVAVLPMVAAVVVAGTGGTTSKASGEIGAARGEPWTGAPGITESVGTIARRQRREDRRTGGRPAGIREKPEPGEVTRPKLPGPAVPQAAVRTSALLAPRSSLTTGTSFLGAQVSESGFIPPDSMGSVGPTQVLVAVNGRIKVFDKQGNLGALNVSDDVFWSSVRNGEDVTDPQVEYDRLTGRWFVSAVNFENSDNRVMLAVSSGPTITDSSSFTFFFFNQNVPPPAGDSGKFADYPQMGVDENAVYIGANMFGGTFSTSAFVVRKSSVLGAGPIVVTAFRNLAVGSGSGPFTPQPAQNMDPNVDEGYIVGVDNQVFSQLDVRRITDPAGTPAISGNLTVPVPTTTFPENVPAEGTHNSLDALDDRLFEGMVARDPAGALSLWTAHNIEVNSSGVGSSSGNRTASRWYQLGTLSTSPTLVQSGTLFDPAASSPRYFWIPSIAANGQGHASLNSSAAGSGRFAEIASSGRLASDPAGATQPFEITQTSSSAYNLGSGPVKRWGDYSQTVVDPTDNMTFWTFQEYANATDSWGVRVIQRKAPPPATPSAASPSTVPLGQPSVSVEITGTSSDGSGFFDPGADSGGPGFPNHISAAVSGGVAVNSVTYTDPTHVTLDLDTTAASNGSKDVTVTNPDGQAAVGSNLLVVGSDTTPPDPPTLNGTSPGSPANDNSPRVFGAAEGGSTVRLYTDAACTAGPVGTGGAASFASPGIPVDSPPLADDSTTTFHATATDGSSNTSACSTSSVTYVEDSTPPAAPTITATDPASPSSSTTPLVKGTSSADTQAVEVFTQASCTGTPTSGTKAAFEGAGIQVTVPANQTTQLSARALDAAGNPSTCSSSFSYANDSSPPAAPTITDTDPDSPSSDPTPMVKGTSSADTQDVDVYTQVSCQGSPTAGTKAAFEGAGIEVTVAANQTTQLSARARDAVGNASACSSSFPYTHDNIPPAEPTSLASSPPSPANDNTPEISGSAEAGSTVNVYKAPSTSDCTGPNLATTGSAADFNSPGLTVNVADDTTTTFRATATDAAGNTSPCSMSSVTYEEDSSLPGTPTITATDPVSPSNSDTNPLVRGSADANTVMVEVFTQENCQGGATPGTKDAFVGAGIEVSVAPNQTTQLSARALGASMNPSPCSGSFPYVHDSIEPASPTLTATSPPSPANDNFPEMMGTAEADSTVNLYRALTDLDCILGNLAATGSAAAFALPGLTVNVADNTSTVFRATATDAAGNTSLCSSSSVTYVEDSAPAPPPSGPSSGGGSAFPSSDFSFGKQRRNKKKGIVILTVFLPGPGEIGLTGKGVEPIGGASAALARMSLAVSGGKVTLRVRPAKPGKSARELRLRLRRKGKATVRVRVTYIPTGGVANTQARKVKLVRKPPR